MGIAESIDSIVDDYRNSQAESAIGMFKNEVIRDSSPFRTGPLRTIDGVEGRCGMARGTTPGACTRPPATFRQEISRPRTTLTLKPLNTGGWHPDSIGRKPLTVQVLSHRFSWMTSIPPSVIRATTSRASMAGS